MKNVMSYPFIDSYIANILIRMCAISNGFHVWRFNSARSLVSLFTVLCICICSILIGVTCVCCRHHHLYHSSNIFNKLRTCLNIHITHTDLKNTYSIAHTHTHTPTCMRSTILFEEQVRFNIVVFGKIFIMGIAYVNIIRAEYVMNRFSTMDSMSCTWASDHSYVLLWLYTLSNIHFSPF